MVQSNKYIGGFFITEAIISILFSQDKRTISQTGRLLRIGMGYYIYNNPVLS